MLNMIKTYLIWLIKAYQSAISPLLGNNCRFSPGCFSYAIDAQNLHGLLKGTWLSLKRVSKCHPWGPLQSDPVPKKKL